MPRLSIVPEMVIRSPSVTAVAGPIVGFSASSRTGADQRIWPEAGTMATRTTGVAAASIGSVAVHVASSPVATAASCCLPVQAEGTEFVPRSVAPQTAQTAPSGAPDEAAAERSTALAPETVAPAILSERAALGRRNEPSPGSSSFDIDEALSDFAPVVFQPRPNARPAPPPPLDIRTSMGYHPVEGAV